MRIPSKKDVADFLELQGVEKEQPKEPSSGWDIDKCPKCGETITFGYIFLAGGALIWTTKSDKLSILGPITVQPEWVTLLIKDFGNINKANWLREAYFCPKCKLITFKN
ncbi:hypothetical protein A3K70_00625 [Candidatus Bathyarchaeota archaeon RBG_16_48_13]|nr:MAG: hypothetical protein A3K70_00625 [Candidatus Bathyarchaeota archaeon RBG_16_48_13]